MIRYDIASLFLGFPQRLPTASASRLRQMYLRSDTIGGRVVIHSARQRNKEKRLAQLESQASKIDKWNSDSDEEDVLPDPKVLVCAGLGLSLYLGPVYVCIRPLCSHYRSFNL